VYHVALVRILTRYARLPTDTAVDIAARLLSAPAEPLALAPGLELRFDNGEFRRQIDARIADGVDTIAPRRRGRPPSTSARP
jgi:hypothetical protein